MQLHIIEEDDELCDDIQLLESNLRILSGWSIRLGSGYLITHRFLPANTLEDRVIPYFAALAVIVDLLL